MSPGLEDDIVSQHIAHFIHVCVEAAVIEIELIWLGTFCLSTVLYFLHTLRTFHSCTVLYWLVEILGVIGRAGIIATLIARTYALCNRNKIVLVGLGSLGIGVVALSFIEVLHTSCTAAPQLYKTSAQCGLNGLLYFIAALGLEFLAIIFNLNSLIPVFVTSYQIYSVAGTLTYIYLHHFQKRLVPTLSNNITGTLTLPIPAILISRFLLELRRVGNNTRTPYITTATISFAHIDQEIYELNGIST
ncbi:hypothetical protein BU17DRAFT_61940 [Hysterangium stoloniferum]|nr:hypothetical protein BU17DRAFT_61940 [Hysterangium stoloniferum]